MNNIKEKKKTGAKKKAGWKPSGSETGLRKPEGADTSVCFETQGLGRAGKREYTVNREKSFPFFCLSTALDCARYTIIIKIVLDVFFHN